MRDKTCIAFCSDIRKFCQFPPFPSPLQHSTPPPPPAKKEHQQHIYFLCELLCFCTAELLAALPNCCYVIFCTVIHVLLYCHIAVQPYCCTAILLYCHTAVLPFCCTAILLYYCTAILSYCCTVILLFRDTAVLPYCYTFILLHCILMYCRTDVLPTSRTYAVQPTGTAKISSDKCENVNISRKISQTFTLN